MKLNARGALMPERGFSRVMMQDPRLQHIEATAWRNHHGVLVLSGVVVDAELPGSDGLRGPTWILSVSLGGSERADKATLEHVVECFAMPAFEEDNHLPGITRTLWCPMNEQYRGICECKLTDDVIVEPDGYAWSQKPGECGYCQEASVLRYAGKTPGDCPTHGGRLL